MTDSVPPPDDRTGTAAPPPAQQRNTGYEYDLIAHSAERDDKTGLLADPLMQLGPYDTRHHAIGMAAIAGRRFGYDYEIRAHETLWRERDEPLECDWCGHAEWYLPIVGWTLASGTDAHDGGAFCTDQCHARWERAQVDKQEGHDA